MLPLGSVVRLKDSIENAKLLIIARLVVVERDGVEGYFEYAACPHAIGANEKVFFYFNEEDILHIYFKGYVDEIELELNQLHEDTIRKTKLPRLKIRK
ncbi:DUF4176 domain-containing protein [Aggregatibacter kilianii]|uniref:DUF4176 domain-containing protein n=1 Tax=Aggregatibacter kilianii TaxID=2025884 RepID=UPI000D659CD2|nr:DUF4176 domain-containing protein [Aggregatibacter kilianii]